MMAFSQIAAVFLCCFLTFHLTPTSAWDYISYAGAEGAQYKGCYARPSPALFNSHEKRGEKLEVGDCTDFCKKQGTKYVALSHSRGINICRCLKNNVHLRQLREVNKYACGVSCQKSQLPCGGFFGRTNLYKIVKRTPKKLQRKRSRRIRYRYVIGRPRYRPRYRPRPIYIGHQRRDNVRDSRSRRRRPRPRPRPSPLLKRRVQKVTRPSSFSIRKPPPRRKPIPKPKIVAVEVERKPGCKPKVVSVDVAKPKPKKKVTTVRVEPKPVSKPKVVSVHVAKPKPKKKVTTVKVEPKPVSKPKVVAIQVVPKTITKPKTCGGNKGG